MKAYCIYITVRGSLDFQNKLQIRAPPRGRFPYEIESLRFGAREILIFFESLGNFYSTVYTILIIYHKKCIDHKYTFFLTK